MAADPVGTLKTGAKQLVNPRGIAGMTGGVIGAPIVRTAVYDAMPGTFRDGDNADTWTAVFQLGQGIVGGAMASGRLGPSGGIVRAVGAGVAVEAARTLLGRYLSV